MTTRSINRLACALLLLAILAVPLGRIVPMLLEGSACACRPRDTNEDLARMMVREHADQAYVRWSLDNPDKRCPTFIEDVSRYTDSPDTLDPWGTRLEMVCESPRGHFGVVSAGQDRRFRTPDDIASWDRGPPAAVE